MNSKTKTILFCRVSSREQADEGYSLDAQMKLLEEYANKHDFEIAKIYKISESASGKQIRKSFLEMLDYATKHKASIILCEKIDRLTRNLKDAATVDDWVKDNAKREVHFIKESFVLNGNTRAHENLVWDMKVAIARFYTNNLSEEVRKGQKEKLAQGWIPMRAKLGYKTIGEKGHKIHIIDEERASLIRKMFELYATGNYSLKALVQVMYEAGLRNENGNKVGKSRMHEYLSDPFYCGKNRWNDMITQGEHEALVSEDLFNEVEAKLTRKIANPQYKKHLPVFKAKVNCPNCGGTITWYTQKGHWYGQHNNYNECPQRVNGCVRQEEVEKQLFPYFDKIAPKNERILKILEKALKEDQAEEIKYHTQQREAFNRIVLSADKRIEGAYKDKLDGKMPVALCEKIMDEASQEKEDANKALQKLSTNRATYYEAGIAVHELALKAKEIYCGERTKTEDKRLLLSYVFSNLSLNAGKIKADYTFAFEFLAKWMPKLNKILEQTKNPSINGAFSMVFNQQPEPGHPSANNNLEPKEVLILPNDFASNSQNHEVCSAARTRTWNHLLNRESLYH